MSLTDIAAMAVKLAKAITFLTGDWSASGILGLVAAFLKNLDLSSLLGSIGGFIG